MFGSHLQCITSLVNRSSFFLFELVIVYSESTLVYLCSLRSRERQCIMLLLVCGDLMVGT